MYRIFVFVTLFLGINYSVFGQTDLSSLQKSRDYLNCRISYFAISEKVSSNASLKKAFDSIRLDLENIQIESPPNYDSLYKILIKKFPRTLQVFSESFSKMDLQPFIALNPSEASKKLVEEAFERLNDAYSSEYDKITPQKDILLTEVSNFLLGDKQSVPIQGQQGVITGEQDNTESSQGNINTKEEKPGFFSTKNFNFWTFLPIVLIFILLLVLKNNVSDINDRIDRRKKEIDLFKDTSDFNTVKNTGSISSSEIDKKIKNNDKIWDLEQAISKLQFKVSRLEEGSESLSKYETQAPVYKQTETESNFFYMSSPNSNYFPNIAKSANKENTVYKFTVSQSKTEALFEVHTLGAPVSEIAKRRESYIKPACDEENFPPPNTRNIITKKTGLARLEGDKWIIITKALIRYE